MVSLEEVEGEEEHIYRDLCARVWEIECAEKWFKGIFSLKRRISANVVSNKHI